MVLFLPAENYDSSKPVTDLTGNHTYCHFNNHPKHFKHQINHNLQRNRTEQVEVQQVSEGHFGRQFEFCFTLGGKLR